MALFQYLGRIISELPAQFDDALAGLDFDAPSLLLSEPTGVPIVVDLIRRS